MVVSCRGQSNEYQARTKYVAGNAELRLHIFSDIDRCAHVLDRPHQQQGTFRIGFGIQRERGSVLRKVMTISIVRVFFLKPTGIRQKNLEQIGRAACAVDWTSEALRDQARKISGMVNVRMRNENRIKRSGIERWCLPIALAEFFQSLEHAAINEHPRTVGFNQVFRSCDGPDASPERNRCQSGTSMKLTKFG